MNTSLSRRILTIFLLSACLRCGGEAPAHPPPTPSLTEVDAGQADAGQGDAALPEETTCQADADCPAEEDVCLEGACLRCGPAQASVEYVYDGDTITLEGGEHVRFLLVNAPEVANRYTGEPAECYGDEARALTRVLLLGRLVELDYDVTCRDRYGRLLAWISVDGLDVNAHLVESGAATVMLVAPNGASRYGEYIALEREAREAGLGRWGACE